MKKNKRKINIVNIIRRVVQIISFILMPGFFISSFAALKSVFTSIISGSFAFSAQLPDLLVLFAVIPVTLLFGRFFCGFVCSFGTLGDIVWFISSKLRRKQRRISEKADRVLKLFKYIFLLFIVAMVWTLGVVTFDNSLNPWNIFGMYATLSGWPSASVLLSLGFALLLLIIAGSVFVQRFFCRYACPLGAFFSVTSKLRFLKIRKARENCGKCRLCTVNCPSGIRMYKYDKINSGECINCFICVSSCPRGNAKAAIGTSDIAPLASGLTAAAAIIGLNYIGRALADNIAYAAPETAITESVLGSIASGNYIDGIYTGSAQGFRGITSVEVKVNNGYITDITVVSTEDDAEFFNRAEYAVINEIICLQSAQVSAVSGATYSSNAIIDAVANALASADLSVSSAPFVSASPDAAALVTQPVLSAMPQTDSGIFADGTYVGSGFGFRGETAVSVVVSGGKIADIQIVSYSDDRRYFIRARDVIIGEIISSQSVDVTTVSGATFSSNGILEAVADALGIKFEPSKYLG